MSSLAFTQLLKSLNLRFFAGVPDSCLSGFCQIIADDPTVKHHVTANEGAAVALGIGFHLATGELPVVYLQNSGLWNALNPYFSLAHPSVYNVPMVFIVGWRGKPGESDEPQHRGTGAVTEDAFRMMGIEPLVLSFWDETQSAQVEEYLRHAITGQRSAAILVSRGVLDDSTSAYAEVQEPRPRRGEVIRKVLESLEDDDSVVAGIGHTGRELYQVRQATNAPNEELSADFLCVGGMGFAHQIAAAVASYGSVKAGANLVVCLDGDGSFLMHMGSAALLGTISKLPLLYVLLNNGTHASVGGQALACGSIDYCRLAVLLGFRSAQKVTDLESIPSLISSIRENGSPAFLWVPILNEPELKLPRPNESFESRKIAFRRKHFA